MFRALRVDKLTIAALETTLKAYHRGALDEIPALRMIRMPLGEVARRADSFAQQLRASVPADVEIKAHVGFSVIGGGSTPDQKLPTHLISISSRRHSAAFLEERLRLPAAAGQPARGTPVIARIAEGKLILDLRTVFPDEEAALAAALVSALTLTLQKSPA
jgi:L-seryl-tRNA(Ser) seleniumtransferase